ncbi:MAG: VCBS repeat-containing protein [Saprospiraceae bacterium]
MKKLALSCLAGCLFWAACSDKNTQTATSESPLFAFLPGSETGITFRNDLRYDRDFNIYKYRNFYNGGGTAIGDVNNDGLADVFFTSNMGQNKLYLNRGNWKFEDATDRAGVAGKGSWSTGVAMADVNGDGWLDIYVCNSGNPRSDESDQSFFRENELFINNGDGTFAERAREYGLADRGLSTHAAFFDYDRDGDLDMYMLNNSFQAIGSFNLDRNLRFTRDSLGGHKLYRNDGPPQPNSPLQGGARGGFRDVSTEAGILGSVIAFGLGVTVGDVNLDGWQDIYVSNDFFERDYLYINQGNGKFSEELETSFRHISAASMGADMADVNNDCWPDIFVTDMLPESDRRIKTTTSFDSYDRFQYLRRTGYFNQFTRNMLHLNNGGKPSTVNRPPSTDFSDIACLAGVEATDWSWGALMFDMDNDGWKDIFVANGIAQDLTNQDYLSFVSDPAVQREITSSGVADYKRLIDSIPSEKVPNYAFRNNGDLTFSNLTSEWGLAQPSFSNGSAYGDLDNDGDLDLVVNNANMEAFVYRNDADKHLKTNHFLKFELRGTGQNTQAIGAKIFVRTGGRTFYQEQMPMRGFESSMDGRPNFGLGNLETADTVIVEFLGGKTALLTGVKTNQILKITEQDATLPPLEKAWLRPSSKPVFENITAALAVPFVHRENDFTDFDRDRLLYFMYSTEGPRLVVADLNGDGREDIFACGASGQACAFFVQTAGGQFVAKPQPAFEKDKASESVDAAAFDADGDGDLDLYVASGGNESEPGSPALADRLYLNDGKGNFTRKPDALPDQKPFATGCARPADVDGDGDVDVFVGARLIPGKVGVPLGGFVMLNEGHGLFRPMQQPALNKLGMVTDAAWNDLDGDGDPDLVVVGEWMPVKIFLNNNGQLTDATEASGLVATAGLWRRIAAGDFNGDGKTDFLLGNHGLNSRLKAKAREPISLFFNDFDKNGLTETILCRYNEGKQLPYTLRGDLVGNLPILKKKYLKYSRYAGQTMGDIFTKEQMAEAFELQASELGSAVMLNLGGGKFSIQQLPNEAQFSPMFGICTGDFDGDGHLDAATGGNFTGAKPEFGWEDADYGTFLKGDGKGGFRVLRSAATGLKIDGEVRDIKAVKVGKRTVLVVARNNAGLEIFGLNR